MAVDLLLCVWLLHFYIVHLFSYLCRSLFRLVFVRNVPPPLRSFILLFIIMIFSEPKIYSFIFKCSWFRLYFVLPFFCYISFSSSLNLWCCRVPDGVTRTKWTSSEHIVLARLPLRHCNIFRHFLDSIVLRYVCARNAYAVSKWADACFGRTIYFEFIIYLFPNCFFYPLFSCLFLVQCWLRRWHWRLCACHLCIHPTIGCHLPVCMHIFDADYHQQPANSLFTFWLH